MGGNSERGRDMALEWVSEEKTLLNIKKIISVVWRMDRRHMYAYYRKMQKRQSEILPGQLGVAFLKKMEWIVDREAIVTARIWLDLMRDTEHILKLIRANRNLDQKVWIAALPKLKARQDRYFMTELGMAFISTLMEKLKIGISDKEQGHNAEASDGNTVQTAIMDEKKELEKVAVWLMEDWPAQEEKVKREKMFFHRKQIERAVLPMLACLSVLCMTIWLYGQIGRNLGRWNLQQMKVSAVQKSDAFIEEKSEVKTGIVSRAEKRKETDLPVKKAKLKNKIKIKKRPEKLSQYREMSEEYPHLYGWLQIPDTQIDMPVMRAESDRDFYLHHDFSGAESAEGALFVDVESSAYPQDDNTVIYGHNMKNGHIFGTLKMYENADFFQAHREIHFDTLYETGVYEAVAVVKTRILNENEQGFRYYRFFQYDNEKEFQECQDFVEDNRMFETGGTLQYGDRILMLSTCEYSQENGRLVVIARKTESVE